MKTQNGQFFDSHRLFINENGIKSEWKEIDFNFIWIPIHWLPSQTETLTKFSIFRLDISSNQRIMQHKMRFDVFYWSIGWYFFYFYKWYGGVVKTKFLDLRYALSHLASDWSWERCQNEQMENAVTSILTRKSGETYTYKRTNVCAHYGLQRTVCVYGVVASNDRNDLIEVRSGPHRMM